MLVEIKKGNTVCPKVLFFSGIIRAFRASGIAHLYEIAQVYPTILLSEELDSETEKILHDKELFPKLEKIIPYREFTNSKAALLIKNRRYCKLAKNFIKQYEPDVIIGGDVGLFQLYLARFAKKVKPTIFIFFQGGISLGEMKQERRWHYFMSTYLKTPSFLPFWIRFSFICLKKRLANFLYYWILPLMAGQKPFIGKSSFILFRGDVGLRFCDYKVVYSKREYELSIRNGVPFEKILISAHPLIRKKTRKFFEKVYFQHQRVNFKNHTKTLTIMFPSDQIGFKKENFSLISKEELEKSRIKTITLIANILTGWKIFIKPHPMIKDNTEQLQRIIQTLEPISNLIKVVDPSEPADKYIEMGDIIVGLDASTTLFTASLQSPEKIILSLNLEHQALRDRYKDFGRIEYIDKEEDLIKMLELIRDNKYSKKYNPKLEKGDLGADEIIQYAISNSK